jgi:hypothetical protein
MHLHVDRRTEEAPTKTVPLQRTAPVPENVVDRSSDRALMRIGAVAGVAGIAVQVAMTFLHPSHADPNNSLDAFEEYSHSTNWTDVHIGQFLGTFLIALSLIALARALSRQHGLPGALAIVGAVTTVMLATIFAVQMAVDGVALRSTIETWANATGAEKSSAFQVAEGMRALEKALSAFFHLSNGATLVALGLSVALGHLYARWLGVAAVLAGLGFLVGGVITGHSGFSASSGVFLTPALLLMVVFVTGICISMWRRAAASSGSPQQ